MALLEIPTRVLVVPELSFSFDSCLGYRQQTYYTRPNSLSSLCAVLPEPSLRPFSSEVNQLNVHAGGPPPWFEINQTKEDTNTNTPAFQSFHSRKSKRVNPKRVGAAWAEKRRAELKMEKGEVVPKSWLPNFGSVWQEGTRKKSRKEFEMRNRMHSGNESSPEISPKVQPYISKRHRLSDAPDI